MADNEVRMSKGEQAIRLPAVEGTFYPRTEAEVGPLIEQARARQRRRNPGLPPIDHTSAAIATVPAAAGLILPHAGYAYSGPTAWGALKQGGVRRHAVVVGPNHTGLGAGVSAAPQSAWRLQGHDLPIWNEYIGKLSALMPELEIEPLAHLREHSVEVELPLLRRFRPDITVAPVVVGLCTLDDALRLGDAIAEAVKAAADPTEVQLIASTDMTHFLSASDAALQDTSAIERIEAFDPAGLFKAVERNHITMCGYIPTVAVLRAMQKLYRSPRARLVEYTHSGLVTDNDRRVVAYASFVLEGSWPNQDDFE